MTQSADAISMLQAIVAMGALTLVMFIWMYATRLPAFSRYKIAPQDAAHPGAYGDRLPSEVRRIADNYNHLFEAPTIFYAIVLAIVLLGNADGLHALCAWIFVGLRSLHSVIQATFNRVTLRFTVFALSWFALGTMIVRETIALF